MRKEWTVLLPSTIFFSSFILPHHDPFFIWQNSFTSYFIKNCTVNENFQLTTVNWGEEKKFFFQHYFLYTTFGTLFSLFPLHFQCNALLFLHSPQLFVGTMPFPIESSINSSKRGASAAEKIDKWSSWWRRKRSLVKYG